MTLVHWTLIPLGAQVLPVALYASECILAVAIIVRPDSELPIDALTYVLLGVYGVGQIRTWELIGRTASRLSWLNHTGDGVRKGQTVTTNNGVSHSACAAPPDTPWLLAP
jgi:hypothetical protein